MREKPKCSMCDSEESRLFELLQAMDIPEMRRDVTKSNLRWLIRNMHIMNWKHKNFVEADRLARKLLEQ